MCTVYRRGTPYCIPYSATVMPAAPGPASQLGWHGAWADPVVADLCGPKYGAEPTTLDPSDDHLAGGVHRIVEDPLPVDGVLLSASAASAGR